MMNFDSWMEDRINGDYGPELDRLDAQEDFQLTAPEGEDSDEDSLGDQTTNDESTGGSLLLGHIQGADDGIEFGGYEPEEPNPYHGTYSEM